MTLLNLIRSKPMIDGIEKDLKTMNKANWKTNTIGVITLAVALASTWAPPQYQARIQQTTAALAGAGLLAARDNNNNR